MINFILFYRELRAKSRPNLYTHLWDDGDEEENEVEKMLYSFNLYTKLYLKNNF
jgi:hypothetical protein